MNALEIHHLSKQYPEFTLKDLSFTLPSGCILGLIGENGAGKSTTIKLILNMIRRDTGTVRVLGKDNREDFIHTKEEIGVVLDEVGYPEALTAKQVNAIMKHTYRRWDERTYFRYLDQLSLPKDREFKEFSRGMKMKLGIATALSHQARLLILDEATSGLDPVVRDEVVDLFHEFTRDENHSILISSHIVSDLEKLCDYMAFLHKGELLLYDEKDVLLEHYGLIHGSREQIARLDRAAIKGQKTTAYGVEAVVERRKVPVGMAISPIGIEDLFIYMVKGDTVR